MSFKRNLVIEVSDEPMLREDRLTTDWIDYESSIYRYADRVHDIESDDERNEQLAAFKKTVESIITVIPNETDDANDGPCFKFVANAARIWFAERYHKLKKAVNDISLEAFCDATTAYNLMQMVCDKYECNVIYYDGYYYPLDLFIRKFGNIDHTMYVGGCFYIYQ